MGLQSHRMCYAFGHVVPLIASAVHLLPFQIITAAGAVDASVADVRLRTLDGADAVGANLWGRMGMAIAAENGCDVVIYGGEVMSPALPIGQYYLTLTSGTRTWYSDVVTVVADTSMYTTMEWWDVRDLRFGAGLIKYSYRVGNETRQYKNRMYFMEGIGMPEYTVEEEGETRDGLFYSAKIISGKKYKMQVAECTEPMCDVLRFVHLSDNVELRDAFGRTYNCDSVLVTPEWVNGGAVASAAIEITTDTFVKQLGGGYEGEEPVSGYTGRLGVGVLGVTFMLGAS